MPKIVYSPILEQAGFVKGALESAFTPLDLFSNGEDGIWLDPSDLSTLFQDAAGTTPVTADGDPVGLMLDKSQGLDLGTELATNGTFDSDISGWTTAGTVTWNDGAAKVAEFGGSDGYLAQGFSFPPGKVAKLSFDVLENTTMIGGSRIRLGPNPGENTAGGDVFFTGTGTKVFYIENLTNADQYITWHCSTVDTYFIIDNISVQEIKGNHATQSVSASRPTYRTDGTLHWLEFDGVDDGIDIAQNVFTNSDIYWGLSYTGGTNSFLLLSESTAGSPFLGVGDPDSASPPDTVVGAISYKVGGRLVTRSREGVYGAVTSATTVVFEMNDGAAGESWDSGVVFGNYTKFTYQGALYSLIISGISPEDTRVNIRDYVADKSGVTL